MNNLAAYTPLESLLLFQALLSHGVESTAFNHISELLKSNALVKAGDTYDAGRLSPDALRELFLHLLRDELRSETSHIDGPERGPSPNSKKRKLQSPPVPTLKEVLEHFDKLPALIDRLYARYRDHVLKQVRDDEQRIEAIQKEIQEIERLDQEDRIRREAPRPVNKNGAPKLEASRDGKLPNGPGPSAIQTPVPVPVPVKHSQTPALQATAEKRDVVPPPVAFTTPPVIPGQISPVQLGAKPQQPLKLPNGPAQVLQPPFGLSQPPPHPVQSQSPVPLPTISPRPEGVPKSKTPGPAPVPSPQPLTPGALKWEKPYQPPATVPSQGRPMPPNVPPNNLVSTPGQPQHPQQWHPQPTGQYSSQPLTPIQPGQAPRYPAQLGQPVLVPPQPVGQLAPSLHAVSPKVSSEGSTIQPPGRPQAAPSVRPPAQQPLPPGGYQHPVQGRPIAAASPTAAIGGTSGQPTAPPARRAPNYPSSYQQPQLSPSPAPTPSVSQAESQRRVSSPFTSQQPRPAIPPYLAPQVAGPSSPAQRLGSAPLPPQTPVTTLPAFITTGSGTKWTVEASPSTPRPHVGELPSPAWEPLSPVLLSATLARQALETPQPVTKKPTPKQIQKIDTKLGRPRGRPPRSAQKIRAGSTTSAAGLTRRSQSVASQADELSLDHDLSARVKDEVATPRLHEETGDTTADESIPSRRQMITPGSVSSRLAQKRKRQDTPTEPPLPPTAPTHVLWTRQFGRVSASALDQISSHRSANTFANPIRDRDAPGYKSIILQPQDIKSIRTAISHGNRAATHAAASLPDGDPGTGSVWLPISDELVPPKGIINSAQLEKELVHMFSNAIMYNLDPNRGPGPAFMKGRTSEEGGDVLGYQVDENAVVRDTRLMFVEVEKLLGDLRSAEKERTGPQPSNANTRPASVATGTGDDSAAAEDDVDELAGDADITSTSKRRRIGTRS